MKFEIFKARFLKFSLKCSAVAYKRQNKKQHNEIISKIAYLLFTEIHSVRVA